MASSQHMRTRLVLLLLALFGGAFAVFKFLPADGAVITTPRLYINRQQADVSSGVVLQLFFTPATDPGTAGKITITFPSGASNDTKWCRTAGSDLVVTGIPNPEGATETATALTSSSSFTASCSQTPDTITINNVAALTPGQKYGVQIAQAGSPTALLGTKSTAANDIKVTVKTRTSVPADVDTGYLALSVVGNDQVVVTAVVDVTLSVSIDTNTANFGTLTTANVSKSPVVSTVSTSAAGGYISLVKYDQTLTSGSNTIGGVSGGTIQAGESEYGASSSQPTANGNTIGEWSPASCTTGATTSNAWSLSDTFQDWASSTTAKTNETATLCLMASTSGTQAPGTYTSTATLVTTARF